MPFVANVKQQRHILKKIWHHFNHSQLVKCRFFTTAPSIFSLQNCNLLHHRRVSSKTQFAECTQNKSQLFVFHHEWPDDVRMELLQDMIVIENFVTEREEQQLCAEAEKSMKRMRYQYDHWDNAIQGYREREKLDWSEENANVIERLRNKAFTENVIPQVHIIDLAADGIIKPHVDSSRYCGNTISGLSLLTDCIMRLKRVDENEYKQNTLDEDKYGSDETTQNANQKEKREFNYFADILLRRRSLYIMKDSARYKFSHEVLPTKSKFLENEIVKDRRISIICRNHT
ncbi:alpha-ketoglutarate-dependent dioxygenase alkB homolog 7, mitochondrial [Contarinia nasturtii]|uniref:alpha-ketoglutarate-dependent dioxygenase alkB homolog 7, mitochondrial n=1 Tax=Contarinia nasturtii TaxID=265458 RepID=UPI0012D3AF75|nr:alpha-ketoglutarate-dependent dioxygenase alkB homolog 7, mitochondrial [Contarinia nasturtii]